MMGWFSCQRAASVSNAGAVTPKVHEVLTRNFSVSTGYDVRHIIIAEFEVRDDGGIYYRVDLQRKSCSCKEFDTLRIPCTHAVAAAVNSNQSAETLVAEEYSNEYWRLAYGGTINPVHDCQFDSESATGGDGMKLLPPRTRRPPGRPRKSRILLAGEFRVCD